MFTLVPSNFFDPASKREALAEVAEVAQGAVVSHIDIPQYDAVLIFSDEDGVCLSGQYIADFLAKLPECPEYNKILISLRDGVLLLAIAQGKSLLLLNSFKAPDFTTAEYYLFLSIKSLQINPEISTLCWSEGVSERDEMSLYRYFKSVVRL